MEPLAVVTRNEYVESIHYGYVCVVDASGAVEYNLGNPSTPIYFRSSAKPIQTIPLVHSGAAEKYHFSAKEIALACASHSGQIVHQEAVAATLERLGLGLENLHCGVMTPYNVAEHRRLMAVQEEPTVLHCSCSGKHVGMLALAKFRGYGLEDYEQFDHPVQQEILRTVAEFAEERIEDIPIGVDGCGVPIYLLPIRKIALSYAKLMRYAEDEVAPLHRAAKAVVDAMLLHPEMVSGDAEFCTDLMRLTHGKLIGKVGAEAVYCVGVRGSNLGICVKISDGNERAVYPVVVEVLKELGVLDADELCALERWYQPKLRNNLQEEIGAILPAFQLGASRAEGELMGRRVEEIISRV